MREHSAIQYEGVDVADRNQEEEEQVFAAQIEQ